ncbi:MAG: hypothetical protein NZ839_04775, partial [Endomicrobia bacterium]|nr:hypothetical protein [Endomicrobiia bacterium]
ISTQYQLQDYTQSRHSVEITSYDDGIPGNTPGNVGINTRPSSTNGEGMWSQTRTSKSDNKQEIYTLNISMPIGAEIPLTKKWLFRAGSVYNMTKTITISKRTSEKVKTTTSVTPAGGATTVETSIVDPTTDYINEGTIYTETHQVLYAYGIEWKPNKNLIIACNAFLDTNTNPTGGKSSILDLDTYRLLAMQVVVKF